MGVLHLCLHLFLILLIGLHVLLNLISISEGQQHEMPTHGEIHTIAGGFSGGGCTASQRKKYARSVMAVDVFEDHSPDVDITFTKEDLGDVVPHDNDPIVVSLVTAGRKVHRVLVDQGSSADVMFWPTFTKL